jgi:hypothetical protein
MIFVITHKGFAMHSNFIHAASGSIDISDKDKEAK